MAADKRSSEQVVISVEITLPFEARPSRLSEPEINRCDGQNDNEPDYSVSNLKVVLSDESLGCHDGPSMSFAWVSCVHSRSRLTVRATTPSSRVSSTPLGTFRSRWKSMTTGECLIN